MIYAGVVAPRMELPLRDLKNMSQKEIGELEHLLQALVDHGLAAYVHEKDPTARWVYCTIPTLTDLPGRIVDY